MGFFYTLDHAIKGELLSQPKPCKAEQADKVPFIRWNDSSMKFGGTMSFFDMISCLQRTRAEDPMQI